MADFKYHKSTGLYSVFLSLSDHNRIAKLAELQKTTPTDVLPTILEIGIIRLTKALTQKESGVLSVEYEPPM